MNQGYSAPQSLISKIISAESGGNPRSLSPVGAMGLMQLMPGTAKNPGFGVKGTSNPWDPVENQRVGTDYFNAMLNRYDGDKEAALIAYNAGPGNADKWVRSNRDYSVLPKRSETEPYVRKILGGGSSDYIGGTAAAPAQTVQQPVAPEQLVPPSGRYSKLADALMAQAAGAKPRGWGELLNAFGSAALGYSLADKADTKQQNYQSKLAKMLGGTATDELPQALISSGDPALMQAGIQAKMQQAQAQAKANAPLRGKERFMSTPGGVMDVETMQIVPGTEKDDGNKPIKVGDTLVQKGPDGKYVPVYQGEPKGAPMNATSMREVFEADEGAQASSNVMSSLDTALELNDKAYSGLGAQTRGYLTSLYGAEGGEATENLQNVVTSQVLENLKATFGGMPTEGERQILLDVQGSVNKAPEVRKQIFERAKAAAQRRLDFNKTKAEGIRSGAYFQPGFDATQAAPSPAGTPPQVNILKQKYGLE